MKNINHCKKRRIYLIIAAAVALCWLLLCSCGCKELSGTYTFGEGVDSSSVTLNDDGTFTFDFSPVSSYLGLGRFSVSGDKLTLETSDGNYRYVFHITDSGIVFDADASSDCLWMGNFTDGSLFSR